MKEEWRKQLQQKMADYEESDIDLSWEEMEKALEANRQKAQDSDKRKAKTIPLWSRRVAAAAVALLLAGVGYWALQHQTPEIVERDNLQRAIDDLPRKTAVSTDRLTVSTSRPTVSTNRPMVSANRLMASTKVVSNPIRVVAADLVETDSEEPLPSNTETSQATEETTDKDSIGSADQSTDKVTSKPQLRPTVIYPSDLRKKTSSHNRLTAKVYFSNGTTGYSSLLSSTQLIPITPTPGGNDPTIDAPSNTGYVDVTHPGEESGDDPGGASGDDTVEGDNTDQQSSNTRQGEILQYRNQQTDETTHHHLPVRLGFSLRYSFNDYWSIESGLTYTRLSSDFTKTVDGKSSTMEQHLTYIGIPINVSYRLWGSRYLNVYLSAGGMVEKMVKGSLQTSDMTTSVSIRPLQFSLNSAVGAEFNISRQFSLYAEPGLGYWFDNGSSVSTYYQDKPLSFNLNFGIRVNPW